MDKMSINEFKDVCGIGNFNLQYDFLEINVASLIEVAYHIARKCEKSSGEDLVKLVSDIDLSLPREAMDVDYFTIGKLLAFSNTNLFNKKSSYCSKYGTELGNKVVYLVMILPFYLQSKLEKVTYENVYEKLK